MSESLLVLRDAVAQAGVDWWLLKCPVSMDYAEHLSNPEVNCVGPVEKQLAQAVTKYLAARDASE